MPAEDILAFGLDPNTFGVVPPDTAEREFIDFQVARARAWLARGRPLLRCVRADNQPLVHLVLAQGHERLDRIENLLVDPFARPH